MKFVKDLCTVYPFSTNWRHQIFCHTFSGISTTMQKKIKKTELQFIYQFSHTHTDNMMLSHRAGEMSCFLWTQNQYEIWFQKGWLKHLNVSHLPRNVCTSDLGSKFPWAKPEIQEYSMKNEPSQRNKYQTFYVLRRWFRVDLYLHRFQGYFLTRCLELKCLIRSICEVALW